jgi:hypothetical protein
MTEIDLVEQSLAMLRTELSPSSADKARLRKAVGLRPRVLEATDSNFERPRPSRWAGVRASGRVGAGLGAAAFGAGLSLGLFLHGFLHGAPNTIAHADRSLEVEAVPRPSSVPPAPPVVPLAQVPGAAPAQRNEMAPKAPRVKPHPHARATASVQPPSGVDRAPPVETELALLRRVERAIRTHEPALALALLGEIDERFPDTRLAEERLAARRIAECGLGVDGAEERARGFLREHPASVYFERLAIACRVAAPASEPARVTNGTSLDTHTR